MSKRISIIIVILQLASVKSLSTAFPPIFSAESYGAVGKDISSLQNLEHAMEVASRFWTPRDDNLPSHFSQAVHHEKRQRWASQLLLKVSNIVADKEHYLREAHKTALTRVLQAAAMVSMDDTTEDRVKKEGVWLLDSLVGVHTLVGRCHVELESEAVEAVRLLMDRASKLDYAIDQACQSLWAMRGLEARVETLTCPQTIVFEDRVKALPFEIVPLGVRWSEVAHGGDVCETLLRAIPFQNDIIVTRHGDQVQERRGTAWIAHEGIGALAYSGKLMPPQPLPEVVQNVMRKVEAALHLSPDFFDCALCNHYADSEAACKFHTDPEHGTMWDRTTVVVAAGSDRTFAFKPINTAWKNWDVDKAIAANAYGDKTAVTINLFSGDLVVMRDNCNDDFYHAVYSGLNDEPRVSLVLKRAVGRGHGLAGQGKRRRANRIVGVNLTESSNRNNTVPTRSRKRRKPSKARKR